MKTFKALLAGSALGIVLLGTSASAPAQSTWNYYISDAGGENSLVTWTVSGDLATPAGSVLTEPESSLTAFVDAPDIFVDSFVANGSAQLIPTPDGSNFQYGGAQVNLPIVFYSADNASAGGTDSFGLLTSSLPPKSSGLGVSFSYIPGTQSALIPIPFSDFNPGTYQSEESEFATALTVNLTVATVPEPSSLAFGLGAVLSAAYPLIRIRRRVE